MNRIEHEKQTVRKMIELYCRHHLNLDAVPEEYQHLSDYACHRLDLCRFGNRKNTCRRCAIHCYAKEERRKICEVMRWAGPRMMLYAPKDAVMHLWYDVLSRLKQ